MSPDWGGGEALVVSPAILTATKSFFANAGRSADFAVEEGTPEEVVEHCKKKLRDGCTWEGGVREFVGFVYRGTFLAAWVSRITEGLGAALKSFKWARQFISLANDEWKVQESGDFEKHGMLFLSCYGSVHVVSCE